MGRTGRSSGAFRGWGYTGRSRLCVYTCKRVVVIVVLSRFRFSTVANMDVMTNKFGNITLRTSTPKRDPGDEDVAILSSFLPEYLMSPAAVSKNKAFGCSLGRDCRLGDPRATPPGRTCTKSSSGLTFFSRFPVSCLILSTLLGDSSTFQADLVRLL